MKDSRARRSFTLMELLTVMGIIALLAGITALGYRGIAKDAKLSSAKNTVMAVLENARGLAMKNNEITGVLFRSRLDNQKNYVEAVLIKWSRQTARVTIPPGSQGVVDRFVVVPGSVARRLPNGIQVAAPYYSGSTVHPCTGTTYDMDQVWVTCSNLAAINQQSGTGEIPGEMIAVLYAPSGHTIMRNSQTSSDRMWVDFDGDGVQEVGGSVIGNTISCANFSGQPNQHNGLFEHKFEHDECYIDIAAFLAVIDDDVVRELYVPNDWSPSIVGDLQTAFLNRRNNYTQYISNNADRIHFNRYTGVAMR